MYGIVSHWTFQSPPNEDLLKRLEHGLIDPLSRLPGFHAYYVVHPSTTELFAIHFWESRAQAEQALQQAGPWLQSVLGHELTGTPERSIGDVTIQRGG